MRTRAEVAALTREMIALVEAYLSKQATRADLQVFAQKHNTHADPAFAGNRTAVSLHTCLYNADQPQLIRDQDLAAHVESLRRGTMTISNEILATVQMKFSELVARTKPWLIRFPIDGIGWAEEARWVSYATNHTFATAVMVSPPPTTIEVDIATEVGNHSPAAYEDLVETLGMPRPDTIRFVPRA